MPADVRKTDLLKKLGTKVAAAHKTHAADETKYGMVDLPPGIKAGIARLAMAKLDEYDEDKKTGARKGDVYVIFRGIGISPEEHGGVRVKGQGVMLSIPLCDTVKEKDGQKVTTTFDEHWADFLNELRKFGIDTTKIPPEKAHELIPGVLLSLQNSKPLYRFSTRGWTPPPRPSDPKPKEMVFVQFDGVISAEEAEVATAANATSGFAAPQGQGGGGDSGDSGSESESGSDDFDLEAVAAKAEAADMSAIELLKDEARKNELTEDHIEKSTSWASQGLGTSLQEMIEAKSRGEDVPVPEEGGESPADEPPPWEPKVGMTCNYSVKAGGKVDQVKVDKIDADKKTADLTNIASKKKVLKVPLAKLSAA